MFLIIPAIDIRNEHCVRLTKGKIETEQIYTKDHEFIAKLCQTQGAERLHITDLNKAFSGVLRNLKKIKKIRKSVSMKIQVGGGIRDIKTIEKVIKSGIDKVILGTTVVYNPPLVEQAVTKFGDKIIIAIDVNDGKLAIGGWREVTTKTPAEVIPELEKIGIKEIIYTDTTKDGTLEGPNLESIKQICDLTSMTVYASGGIANIEDIKKLIVINKLKGVVIGRAIYADTLKLSEAVEIAKNYGT